jgi:hypothetical protein
MTGDSKSSCPLKPYRIFATCAAWLGTLACSVGAEVSYYDSIKPVLAVHCHKCHDAETQKGELRLDLAAGAMKGGESGEPAIVPGASAKSEVMRRITSHEKGEKMPPKGPRLTEAEVARIRQWIDEGAKWPQRDDYWAFQPPREVAVPGGEAANPIDRFIGTRLEAEGIRPVERADRRTLLRRAFFDLVGLPPTPEEAALFLDDSSPGAFARLIDRLLADPRHGERWARHWLDLVRYGESDGYEDDKIRPHAWRYRDYVIRALNADKPYDRFVREQIAGDELWPNDPDAWIATGFARLGAWDGMSKDPAQQRQDFLADTTDAVGAVFLGVTIGCARCHDHKYDVITQRDYFGVQAFFASVKREAREMKVPPIEPASITAACKAESAELASLKTVREDLLRDAREILESEGEKKIDDSILKKKAASQYPGRLEKLDAEIKALGQRLRFHVPKVEAVFNDGGAAPKMHILKGGQLSRPGEEVTPGFIEAMAPAEHSQPSGTKRSDLARWLVSPDHPLTARVMVNRLWQHHFGAGLVATASDFGRNGRQPSHPDLLDWLARQFVAEGYSLKQMHRRMMLSEAYQRSASPDTATAAAKDPENRLLWRMNRRRIEGEAIRDTILAVSGVMNRAMGGPGVYARLPKGVNVEFPNNDKELSWGTVTEEDNRRRSIYLFQRRSLSFPLTDVFDGAPMNQSCAARAQTTVAPQALALFNGEFAREAAAQFAARLRRECGGDAEKQIARAFQLAFTREPSEAERSSTLGFLGTQAGTRATGGEEGALTDFCHVLLNTNELIHPD